MRESLARYHNTGEYRDPDFEGYRGEMAYYDVRSDKLHVLRPEVSEIGERVM